MAESLAAAAYPELRRLMFSIAYRMVGSAGEAEDLAQEAFLRLHRAETEGQQIESPRAFLSTVTTRLAIDHMRSARTRRETYFGPWIPEPVLTSDSDAFQSVEIADTISLSFLLLLESLSPVERAVFLLREVFDFEYAQIATIVEKSEPNCRQIFTRARKHVEERKPRFSTNKEQQQLLADRFFDAAQNGNLEELVKFLAADVVFYGDGGGKARGLPQPVFGQDRVHRFLATGIFGRFSEFGLRMQQAEINGQPGALLFDAQDRLINALALEIGDGVIHTVRSIINPDKLGHLGFPLSPIARVE